MVVTASVVVVVVPAACFPVPSLIVSLMTGYKSISRIAVLAKPEAHGDTWRFPLADRSPRRRCFLRPRMTMLRRLSRRRALSLLDCSFLQQRTELLVNPPGLRSLGFRAATEEQGCGGQFLRGSSEDRWSRRGFLVVEDASVDVTGARLRGAAGRSPEGRALLVDTELEFVQLAYPVLDMSGTRRRWR